MALSLRTTVIVVESTTIDQIVLTLNSLAS